jgi:hypothetical protein
MGLQQQPSLIVGLFLKNLGGFQTSPVRTFVFLDEMELRVRGESVQWNNEL